MWFITQARRDAVSLETVLIQYRGLTFRLSSQAHKHHRLWLKVIIIPVCTRLPPVILIATITIPREK